MRSLAASAVALFVAISLAAGSSAEPPLGGAPVEGLLLLKNGEILAGRIARSGDYYVVAAADSELQIRLHEAVAVCQDMDEVLRWKTASIDLRRPDDRLDLAQWCIAHGLYGAAAREITEAYRLDDLNPRVPLLERRLKAAMTAPKAAATAPAAVATKTYEIDDETLDAAARSISPEALQEFSARVQPLLVNYCAAAGCHGPRATSDFKLHRLYLNERNDPRLVRLNLHAALGQIDRKQVSSSRLLTVPLSPHGGGKKPVFHTHNAEHYRQLANWVTRTVLTTPAKLAPPPTVDHYAGALMQRLPIAPPTIAAPAPSAPSATPTAAAAGTMPSPPAVAVPTNEPRPAAAKPEVVDPFDPAEFNRKRTETPPKDAKP
jgi:hypothetical protein